MITEAECPSAVSAVAIASMYDHAPPVGPVPGSSPAMNAIRKVLNPKETLHIIQQPGMTSRYQANIVRDFQGLVRIRTDWDRLVRPSNVFTKFAWLHAWWDEVAQQMHVPPELFVIVVRRGKEIVAIAPLVRRTLNRAGVRIRRLQFATAPYADYHDFLTSDNPLGQITAIFECLFSQKAEWDLVELLDIPHHSCIPLLTEHTIVQGLSTHIRAGTICPYLELIPPDQKLQRRIRKRLSSASKAGFQFKFLSGTIDAKDFLPQIISLERKHCAQRSRELVIARHPTFFTRIINDFPGSMYISLLHDRENIISYELGFCTPESILGFTRGFDPAFGKVSPGIILQAAIIDWACRNGYREYDFTRGGEPYKFLWSANFRCNHQLLMWHSTLRSRLAADIHRLLPRWRNAHAQ